MLVRTVLQRENSVVYWLWFLVVEYLIVGNLLSHTVLKLTVPLGRFLILFLLASFVIEFPEEERHVAVPLQRSVTSDTIRAVTIQRVQC